MESELRPWSNLPAEILEPIASHLFFLADRIRFAAVCKGWNSITLPPPRNDQPPWLVHLYKDQGVCNLYDPSSERTYSLKSSELIGASIHSSKLGWLLLSKSSTTLFFFFFFFFNPFTSDKIDLPPLPPDGLTTTGASFSSPPTSPDCSVCLIKYGSRSPNSLIIYTCNHDFKNWVGRKIQSFNRIMPQHHGPVFCGGRFYFPAHGCKVGVFDPSTGGFTVIDNTAGGGGPRYTLTFVTEIDGEVHVLLVPAPDQPVRVVRTDGFWMRMPEITRLGNRAIYMSPQATMVAAPLMAGAEDRICYPLFRPADGFGRIGYFSMKSRQYYPGLEFNLPMELSKLLVESSRLSCAWIEPKLRE